MVYVQNRDGSPLMPCSEAKARHLIQSGKAKVVKRTPFTIRLRFLVEEHVNTEKVSLGLDAGAETMGISVTAGDKVLYEAEIAIRKDVPKNMEERGSKRSGRRNRKTRYRKQRFNNRRRPKGWLTPTMESKVRAHVNAIDMVCSILPVTEIIIEVASFDIQKIKDPSIEGKDYQEGEQLSYENVKAYVKARDFYRCRCCGSKEHLEVHHIKQRKDGGSNRPDNLITLCSSCHKAWHEDRKKDVVSLSSNAGFKAMTEMSTMRWFILDRVRTKYPDISVRQTYGYVTNHTRNRLGLEKRHCIDARVISGNAEAIGGGCIWIIRKQRCHNRCLHKDTILKGGIRKANQAPRKVNGYGLNDIVLYNGTICYIHGRRSSGYFDIRKMDGTKVHAGINFRHLTLVERASTNLMYKEDMAIPPSGRA